jgi:hypothetical protein
MNRRSIVLPCALVGIAAFCLGAAGTQQATSPPEALEALLVRQAEGYARLAELNLQSAVESNRKAPGSISAFMMQALEQAVEAARGRVKQAQSGQSTNLFAGLAGAAAMAVKIAEADLARAERPDGFPLPEVDLARLRAKLEIARAERDIMQALGGQPVIEQLQWLVGRQEFQLSDLSTRVEALEARP